MKQFITFLIVFNSFLSYAQLAQMDSNYGTKDTGLILSDYIQLPAIQDPYGIFKSTQKILLQSNGKTVYTSVDTNESISLARFLRDGTPDSSFGSNGSVFIPETQGSGTNATCLDIGNNVLLARTGYLRLSVELFKVKRYGVIDSCFGKNGKATLTFPDTTNWTYVLVNSIQTQKNHKILVTGTIVNKEHCYSSNSNSGSSNSTSWLQYGSRCVPICKIFAARFNSDGSIDSSYNGKGYNDSLAFPNAQLNSKYATHHYAFTSAMQSDGKLLVGGHPGLAGFWGRIPIHNYALVRVDTSGHVDSSFSAIDPRGVNNRDFAIRDVTVQADDKIVFTTFNDNQPFPVIYRVDSDGARDSSFGTDGAYSLAIWWLDFDNQISIHSLWDSKIAIGFRNTITIMDKDGTIDTLCGQGNFNLNSNRLAVDVVADQSTNELYVLSRDVNRYYVGDNFKTSRYQLNTGSIHQTLWMCDSTYTMNGKTYTSPGDYLDTLTSVHGCDSIVWTTLVPRVPTYERMLVCDSSITIHGKTRYSSGVYLDTLTSFDGCDSLKYTTLDFVRPSYDSISALVCEYFVSPKGRVLTRTGSYSDTLVNAGGCDSIIYIALEVTKTLEIIDVVACSDYYSPSGDLWTESGSYVDTLSNRLGCDSIIAITLHIAEPSSSFESITTCNSYTSPSGKLWTETGTYLDTIANVSGCDSFMSIDLTILPSTDTVLNITQCESWTSPSGKLWTQSGNYIDIIDNVQGCDSIITVELTILSPTRSQLEVTSCFNYTAPSGKVFNTSGIYSDTLMNAAGCDSIITVDLTVNTVDIGIIQLHNKLVSTATGAKFQWLDCNDANAEIQGKTYQFLDPIDNGIYAVQVAQNNCVDTSECYSVSTLSREEFSIEDFKVYPNPTTGLVTVEVGHLEEVNLTITDSKGNLIYKASANQGSHQFELDGAAGIYILRIQTKDSYRVYRLLKQ